jgi:hypothetical protein
MEIKTFTYTFFLFIQKWPALFGNLLSASHMYECTKVYFIRVLLGLFIPTAAINSVAMSILVHKTIHVDSVDGVWGCVSFHTVTKCRDN